MDPPQKSYVAGFEVEGENGMGGWMGDGGSIAFSSNLNFLCWQLLDQIWQTRIPTELPDWEDTTYDRREMVEMD